MAGGPHMGACGHMLVGPGTCGGRPGGMGVGHGATRGGLWGDIQAWGCMGQHVTWAELVGCGQGPWMGDGGQGCVVNEQGICEGGWTSGHVHRDSFPGAGGGGGTCGGHRFRTDSCRTELIDIEGSFVVCKDLKAGGGTGGCDGVADWDLEGGVGAEALD